MINANLRPAGLPDLESVNAIYNHYVLTSTATYQTSPESAEGRMAWFTQRDLAKHPVMVVESGEQIVAWGSLSPFGKREAFGQTVENSIYVHPAHHRQGLGNLLLTDQLDRAQQAGHHTIIAAISSGQTASLALHQAHGFLESGRLRQVGWKFGEWLDLVYLQKLL